ncbi:hypothetical protein J6590_081897 [Homalodisca vitripennis]|nr:hypothetical protein J6590_081897 [Homalodisca vitripennis]
MKECGTPRMPHFSNWCNSVSWCTQSKVLDRSRNILSTCSRLSKPSTTLSSTGIDACRAGSRHVRSVHPYTRVRQLQTLTSPWPGHRRAPSRDSTGIDACRAGSGHVRSVQPYSRVLEITEPNLTLAGSPPRA